MLGNRSTLMRCRDFGWVESTARDGAEVQLAEEHFSDRYKNGESMMQLAQRIYSLLVAHNGIARNVQSYFFGMTNMEYAQFRDLKLQDPGIQVAGNINDRS